MAKHPELASVAELDARLKRVDEPRWLASRYALSRSRRRLVLVGLIAAEIRRAMGMPEAMLGRIRVQWWRESVEAVQAAGPVRRHDLVEELAIVAPAAPAMLTTMLGWFDAADGVLDDHMSAGGHVAGAEHSERHVAAESGLMRTSAAALGARLTEAEQALLESCARGWVSCLGAMPDVAVQWTSAQGAFAALSAELLPAVVHIAAGPGSSEDAPLGIRWRIFRAVLTRRLPPVPRRD